jgi:hypothetical protein
MLGEDAASKSAQTGVLSHTTVRQRVNSVALELQREVLLLHVSLLLLSSLPTHATFYSLSPSHLSVRGWLRRALVGRSIHPPTLQHGSHRQRNDATELCLC